SARAKVEGVERDPHELGALPAAPVLDLRRFEEPHVLVELRAGHDDAANGVDRPDRAGAADEPVDGVADREARLAASGVHAPRERDATLLVAALLVVPDARLVGLRRRSIEVAPWAERLERDVGVGAARGLEAGH